MTTLTKHSWILAATIRPVLCWNHKELSRDITYWNYRTGGQCWRFSKRAQLEFDYRTVVICQNISTFPKRSVGPICLSGIIEFDEFETSAKKSTYRWPHPYECRKFSHTFQINLRCSANVWFPPPHTGEMQLFAQWRVACWCGQKDEWSSCQTPTFTRIRLAGLGSYVMP